MNDPVFAAMSRTSAPPGRWRRARWLAFLLTMLGFNAYPLGDLFAREPSGTEVAAVVGGLAVLAALWVRTMWLSLATTVPFRARAPWAAGVIVVGAGLGLVMGGQFNGLLIYVSIACAVSLSTRWVLPALAGAAGVAAVIDVFHRGAYGAHRSLGPLLFDNLSFVFFLGLMMWFYRRVMMLISELRRAREDLARLAVTEERLRFARDLHDLLGHSLSSIALKCQLARRLAAGDDAVRAEIADVEAVARRALVDIRAAVTGYRQTGLSEELETARGVLAAAGIRLSADLPATPLPVQADAMLGWVVREAATNVLRHSRARRCEVRVRRGGDVALLTVSDDGVGPPAVPGAGNGLVGLAERVTAVGGTLETGPAPERGFRLTVRLPLATPCGAAARPTDTAGARTDAGTAARVTDVSGPRPADDAGTRSTGGDEAVGADDAGDGTADSGVRSTDRDKAGAAEVAREGTGEGADGAGHRPVVQSEPT